MIHGNTDGIRKALLEQMETLYEQRCDRDEFINLDILRALCDYSALIKREIALYIGREGIIEQISIGDGNTVSLESLTKRRSLTALSGIRLIHTHPNGDHRLSNVDRQALRDLRFDAMSAVGVSPDGLATGISVAYLGARNGNSRDLVEFESDIRHLPQREWMEEIAEAQKRLAAEEPEEIEHVQRAFLFTMDSEHSLEELKGLAETAGAVVAGQAMQARKKPDSATYLGSGKAKELSLTCQANDCDVFIVDDEISGAQQRNLEEIFGLRVIDRTQLILDIFAQRAHTREAKMQVKLAQLRYELPRLTGYGESLSRQGAGRLARGAGEMKLELDKRHLRQSIADIEAEMDKVRKQRSVRRAQRKKLDVPTVALVGYTNAGKSTLLNRLSGSDVYVQDQLFATLDTTTRKVRMPGGADMLFVDTVGFIDKLPHDLVRAFQATLEETIFADLLVVVTDASNPDALEQCRVVQGVLEQLGAQDRPIIEALNKVDKGGETPPIKGGLAISAATGEGLDELLTAIEKALRAERMHFRAVIPYTQSKWAARLHDVGELEKEEYAEDGVHVEARVDAVEFERLFKDSGIDVEIL